MADESPQSSRSSRSEKRSEPNPEAILERLQILLTMQQHAAVYEEIRRLLRRLQLSEDNFSKLKEIYDKLLAKIDALMAHEHYAVTITDVSRNGRNVVEVAGLGQGRVRIAVHPEVDPAKLVVGATALVTRERNCLIEVINTRGSWREVGHFERYLGASDRMLLREHDTLIAVDAAHTLIDVPLEKGDLVGYDRDGARIAYERIDPANDDDLFDESVTDDFAQLGGLDGQIRQIKGYIDFRFRHPEVAAKYRLKDKSCILLSGPPGNGKTRIARCCAGYVRSLFPDLPCRFMYVAGASVYSMWLGQSEQNIMARFRAAREAARHGPVMMFWDEIDAIGRSRGTDFGSSAPDRILNTLLSQLDGIEPLRNIFVLLATNRPWMLDSALLRAGRTDVAIEIPAPNRKAAGAILHHYLGRGIPLAGGKTVEDLILPLLSRVFAPNGACAVVAQVKLSDGRRLDVPGKELLSGAMLEQVVEIAGRQAANREVISGEAGIAQEDLILALETQLLGAAKLLAPGNIKSRVTSIPQDAQPIAVDPVLSSATATYSRQE